MLKVNYTEVFIVHNSTRSDQCDVLRDDSWALPLTVFLVPMLKEWFSQFCHFLTLVSFQTGMAVFS